MIDGGEFLTEETYRGYRWIYISPRGATYYSPKSTYKSKAAAKRAGQAWLDELTSVDAASGS